MHFCRSRPRRAKGPEPSQPSEAAEGKSGGWRTGEPQRRHDGPIAPNRFAERTAPPTRPDEVWAVDMTYIETTEGWRFLAVVLDLHRRKIVGWAFAQSLPTALPLAALQMALTQRRPARDLLHHRGGGDKWGMEMGEPAIAAASMPVTNTAACCAPTAWRPA